MSVSDPANFREGAVEDKMSRQVGGGPQTTFNNTGGIQINGLGIGSFNGFDQWTYAAKDVLTKVHGAHNLKMGGEFTRLLSVDAPFWADRPSYTFNNIWDFLNDAPITENAQFDPATGIPSAQRKDLRNNIIGLFVQDNYKVKPNLTITVGLRWEYFGPPHNAQPGYDSNVYFGAFASPTPNGNPFLPNTPMVGAIQGATFIQKNSNLWNKDTNNFGPRVGFNWATKGGNLSVAGINVSRTIACNDSSVSVSGVSNTVVITGHCASLSVSGVQNKVTVQAADSIQASGFNNEITYLAGSPHIDQSGQGNAIQKG